MACQQREAEQQAEQITEHHPFMLQVDRQSTEPGAKLEAGEQQFVNGDRGQPGQRDLQGVVVQ